MNNLKMLLLSSALFVFCQSVGQPVGQTFILQETNIKKNLTQCQNAAKKCQLVLLKKQTSYTLSFSSKSTLTSNFLNGLSDHFIKFFPKESTKSEGPVIDRAFINERDQIIKFTYGYLPPDKKATTDYVQIIVIFDNSGTSPKINDIQVKNKVDLGIITLTEREMLKFKPEPKPAAKPVTKPATKKPAAKKKT